MAITSPAPSVEPTPPKVEPETSESPVATPKSRRAILAGGIGGVFGLLAGRLARPDRAVGAAGDPLIIGSAANNAGTSNTVLTTNSTVVAFELLQNGAGTALMGYVTPGSGTTRGVYGRTDSPNGDGVQARNAGTAGSGAGVHAFGGANHGVLAETTSNAKNAVRAIGANGTAIFGSATQVGVQGEGYVGVSGTIGSASFFARGVVGDGGTGTDNVGVYGTVNNGTGVGVSGVNSANSNKSFGVLGHTAGTTGFSSTTNPGSSGVVGTDNGGSNSTQGVFGVSTSTHGSGLHGRVTQNNASAYGVWGHDNGNATSYAIFGNGQGAVTGAFSKASGTFKIDHPLDPANKYLQHSFVESPDMMNIYNGIATLAADGTATVTLPDWFGALNASFRYQLTAIGKSAPGLFISAVVKDNRFSIAGGAAGQDVSWQVTGIRQDKWAKAHPVEVELVKQGAERGRYLHAKEHGKAASMAIDKMVMG
ncbi:MAG TPA: hypothetical protein VL687_07585 [Methylomirabilota bacterium]|nr:hypothetical protein [Methylomirabilota bacterium]